MDVTVCVCYEGKEGGWGGDGQGLGRDLGEGCDLNWQPCVTTSCLGKTLNLSEVVAIKAVDDNVVRVGRHSHLCKKKGSQGNTISETQTFLACATAISINVLVRSLFHAWHVTGMTGLVTTFGYEGIKKGE